MPIKKLPPGLRLCFQFYFKGDGVEEDFVQFEAPDIDRLDMDEGAFERIVEAIEEKLSIQLGHALVPMEQADIEKHLKRLMAGEILAKAEPEGTA